MYVKEYLDRLAETGREIIYLERIGREYEATRYAYQHRDKVLVFKVEDINVNCYTNLLNTREEIYRVLGVENDLEAYAKINRSLANPAKPRIVDFSNYFKETKLSLNNIPFIKYFREDGAPYLTSSIIISCIGEVCNASFHRLMYIDEHRAAVRIVPRHLYKIYGEYLKRGRDTPVAILLGVDPLLEIFSSTTPPYGVFEVEAYISAGGDDRVVETPIHQIPVPVSASIVLEGVISRNEYVDEGPFVDILGLVDRVRKQPVFKLERIYVNSETDAFYHAIVPSLWEHVLLMGFPREALIYESISRVSPNVKSVRLTLGSGGWLHVVVSVEQSKPGEARNVGLAVLTAHPSVKHVVVVDHDIDVDDPLMIEWAIATRVRGGEDIVVLRNTYGSTLDPRSSDGLGDKVLIDATKPYGEPWDKYRRVEIP